MSSRQASIVIIHHEHAPRKYQESYLISILAGHWEQQGIVVQHLDGTDNFAQADITFLHVDLSVVPEVYSDFASRYPIAINSTVLDIRKRAISSLALSGQTAFKGPVIVKTDLNAGGMPERRIRFAKIPRLLGATQLIFKRFAQICYLSACEDRITCPSDYEIYSTASDVPEDVYQNPKLIIEKFVPEYRDGGYNHRRYYFLGESEVNQLWLGTNPICANDKDGIEVEAPIPQDLRDFRHQFGIDFGKIDYVLGQSGEVIVLDVNKTPWGACRDPADKSWLVKLCGELHKGICLLL